MSFRDKRKCPPIVGASYDDFPVSEACCPGMRMLENPVAHLPRPLWTDEEKARLDAADAARIFDIAFVTDEVYASRSGEDLIVRWAIPRHPFRKGPLPVMAYVEGSAWGEQRMSFGYRKHGLLLENGWAIASIKHRASWRAPFPAHLLDAKTGLRFVKSRCADKGLDKRAVVLWGCSSGGHTVSLLAVTRDVPELDTEDLTGEDLGVCGVVDCFGPSALHLFDTEPLNVPCLPLPAMPGPDELFGGISLMTDCPQVRRAEPETYISPARSIPPFLILHGSKDMVVPMGQSVMLYGALKAAGKDAQLWCVDRAGHECDGFWSPPTERLILDTAEKWIKDVTK